MWYREDDAMLCPSFPPAFYDQQKLRHAKRPTTDLIITPSSLRGGAGGSREREKPGFHTEDSTFPPPPVLTSIGGYTTTHYPVGVPSNNNTTATLLPSSSAGGGVALTVSSLMTPICETQTNIHILPSSTQAIVTQKSHPLTTTDTTPTAYTILDAWEREDDLLTLDSQPYFRHKVKKLTNTNMSSPPTVDYSIYPHLIPVAVTTNNSDQLVYPPSKHKHHHHRRRSHRDPSVSISCKDTQQLGDIVSTPPLPPQEDLPLLEEQSSPALSIGPPMAGGEQLMITSSLKKPHRKKTKHGPVPEPSPSPAAPPPSVDNISIVGGTSLLSSSLPHATDNAMASNSQSSDSPPMIVRQPSIQDTTLFNSSPTLLPQPQPAGSTASTTGTTTPPEDELFVLNRLSDSDTISTTASSVVDGPQPPPPPASISEEAVPVSSEWKPVPTMAYSNVATQFQIQPTVTEFYYYGAAADTNYHTSSDSKSPGVAQNNRESSVSALNSSSSSVVAVESSSSPLMSESTGHSHHTTTTTKRKKTRKDGGLRASSSSSSHHHRRDGLIIASSSSSSVPKIRDSPLKDIVAPNLDVDLLKLYSNLSFPAPVARPPQEQSRKHAHKLTGGGVQSRLIPLHHVYIDDMFAPSCVKGTTKKRNAGENFQRMSSEERRTIFCDEDTTLDAYNITVVVRKPPRRLKSILKKPAFGNSHLLSNTRRMSAITSTASSSGQPHYSSGLDSSACVRFEPFVQVIGFNPKSRLSLICQTS